MIGSALADALCLAERNIRVIGTGRSKERASNRFNYSWFKKENFHFIEHDVVKPFVFDEKIDFIIHAASPGYPAVYAKFLYLCIRCCIWDYLCNAKRKKW